MVSVAGNVVSCLIVTWANQIHSWDVSFKCSVPCSGNNNSARGHVQKRQWVLQTRKLYYLLMCCRNDVMFT